MPRQYLPIIEQDSFIYAQVRVAVRLIALDNRRNPSAYATHPPTGVLQLAERLRSQFPTITWALIFCAKHLAQGYTLKEIRWLIIDAQPRALHKRRGR